MEAKIFSSYLIGCEPTKMAVRLYTKATSIKIEASPSDVRLLQFAHKHPAWIGALDGGLALLRPHSEVRRRIYIMFAILEATPEYAHLFLPQERSKAYALRILAAGIRAGWRGLIGTLIVKIAGRS